MEWVICMSAEMIERRERKRRWMQPRSIAQSSGCLPAVKKQALACIALARLETSGLAGFDAVGGTPNSEYLVVNRCDFRYSNVVKKMAAQ
ncbi:hypothetical protein G7047_29030 [Diaphorobacter sp. HDW4A]|uniref:hypothetical protein n=1 Tax=Diaphorobacter sp. HDW4A TaxID=2714924 RepID=UPI001407F2B7|nr:hypothetical protein [Diaphorobacter sp. HDW4A]QIL83535.1 hypothetical protein G7047_29030 [Diaphorobacter sp. HDW4A]